MDLPLDQKKIRQWLQTDAGQQVLTLTARRVRKRIVSAGIPFSVLNLSLSADYAEVDSQIASEMALFILENRSDICAKLSAPEADRGRIMTTLLFRYLLDLARSSPRQHPLRYLYKHTADVLRESAAFHTKAKDHKSTLFSLKPQSREIGPIAEDEYASVPWPPALANVVTLAEVNNRKNLLCLARWFWEQVSEMFDGEPVWIPLRDLVHWIGRFVSLKIPAHESLDETKKVIPGREDSGFDAEKLRLWARNFSGRLSRQQQEALYFCYCEGLNQNETAARMGLKGASGVNYHLDRAAEKIRAFSADLPWLSPDSGVEANDQARDFFMETLMGLLKKQFSLP